MSTHAASSRARIACAVIAIVAASSLFAPHQAHAQCGASTSECRNCHEVRGARSVLTAPSAWHRDHAFGDFCALCHGGDPACKNEAAAHVGLLSPLRDPAATCGSCHGGDASSLAERYKTAAAAASSSSPPSPPPPSSGASSPRGIAWGNVALSSVVLLVFASGAFYVTTNERRLRGMTTPSTSASKGVA